MPARTVPFKLVYLLRIDARGRIACTVHRARILNPDAVREAISGKLTNLLREKERDYLKKEEQKLIPNLAFYHSRGTGLIHLEGRDGFTLLQSIVATKRAYLKHGIWRRLHWNKKKRQAALSWETIEGTHNRPILELASGITSLATEPVTYLDEGQHQCGQVVTDVPEGLACAWVKAGVLDHRETCLFCVRLFNQFANADFPIPDGIKLENSAPAGNRQVMITVVTQFDPNTSWDESGIDLNEQFHLKVKFRYGKREVEWRDKKRRVSYREGDIVVRYDRDESWEEDALERVRQIGFVEYGSSAREQMLDLFGSEFHLPAHEKASWHEVLANHFPNLEKAGWSIVLPPHVPVMIKREGEWFSSLEKQDRDWFSFDSGFLHRGKRVSILPLIQRLLVDLNASSLTETLAIVRLRTYLVPIEGEPVFATLPGERIAHILEHLIELTERGAEVGSDGVRIGGWRAAEIAADTEWGVSPPKHSPEFKNLVEFLRDGYEFEPAEPSAQFRGKLRGYQKRGLGWLRFLDAYRVNGILADDMGLGKTIQTLAYLQHLKEEGDLDMGALVVCPASLLDNWQEEARRFAADLKTLILHGYGRRAHYDTVGEYHLIITTYGLIRQDIDRLGDREWSCVVLDEAQFIRNRKAKTTRAIYRLRSVRRLALTGTPIENTVGDLWSIFQFLMPGFLGDASSFTRRFGATLGDQSDPTTLELSRRLRRRLAPFILRRLKEEVAKELPPKTVMVHSIELSETQLELYEAVRLQRQRHIRERLEEFGLKRSYLIVLDALLKLRQICCDPRLYTKDVDSENGVRASGKLSAALALIDDLVANGHRILLYSQFTSMLALFQTELDRKKIPYLILTGKSRNRGDLVKRFNHDPSIPLFLISLKAGGLGLNLPEADIVIHYDPWWNPAVENQATDRAHRIGQTKPVFVYKMIAENTIESKILQLQQHKEEIAKAILAGEGEAGSKLEKEDIEWLLGGDD